MLRTVLRVVAVSLILLVPLGIYLAPALMAALVTGIATVAPLWLPLLLAAILAPLWLHYMRSQYVSGIRYTTLELKPGDDTPRTARAMEIVFYSLYHRVDISRMMAILTGQVRLPWSFEIMAHAGTVRFFIHVPTTHRAAIESRLRAEYRDVDIDEVRDYAREVGYDAWRMRLVTREYTLEKPDPYPLSTYEEYEAEALKPGKGKALDPLLALLEELVSVGEGEYLYLSLMVRPHQRDRRHLWEAPTDTLHEDAHREIAKIVGSAGDPALIPESKRALVTAIEHALKKPSFDTGLRTLYMATREQWSDERAARLDTLFEGFSAPDRNSITSIDPRAQIGWPLVDIFTAAPPLLGSYLLNLYRRRAFFAPPYYGKPMVLNTAELATLFHLPLITRASALARSRGKRLEPPDNLPLAV